MIPQRAANACAEAGTSGSCWIRTTRDRQDRLGWWKVEALIGKQREDLAGFSAVKGKRSDGVASLKLRWHKRATLQLIPAPRFLSQDLDELRQSFFIQVSLENL